MTINAVAIDQRPLLGIVRTLPAQQPERAGANGKRDGKGPAESAE
jgi:hypothetical protein